MVVLKPNHRTSGADALRSMRRMVCVIGGHDPAGIAWNHGYAFAHCARCGSPIMRAVFGRWRTPPTGYRIVWPGQKRASIRPGGTSRAVGAQDFMSDGAIVPPPRLTERLISGDFMAEDSETSPAEPPRRHQAR